MLRDTKARTAMLEADTAAIETSVAKSLPSGLTESTAVDWFTEGLLVKPDQRMWVAKSHEALLRMIERRRWRPKAA